MENMASFLERYEQEVSSLFPVKALRSCDGGHTVMWLECVGAPIFEQDRTLLTLRLIEFHVGTDGHSVSCVKEQQCWLPVRDAIGSAERFMAFLQAQAQVLSHALCHEDVPEMMPHDLWFGDVLTLKRAHDVDDFARALSVKSRLGKWIDGI